MSFFEKLQTESAAIEEDELAQLIAFFGDYPHDAVFSIASSNVFVHTPDLCIPAEIGLVHYSLTNGIMEEVHSLVECTEQIPEAELDNVVALTTGYHGISPDDLDRPLTQDSVAHNQLLSAPESWSAPWHCLESSPKTANMIRHAMYSTGARSNPSNSG